MVEYRQSGRMKVRAEIEHPDGSIEKVEFTEDPANHIWRGASEYSGGSQRQLSYSGRPLDILQIGVKELASRHGDARQERLGNNAGKSGMLPDRNVPVFDTSPVQYRPRWTNLYGGTD